LITPVFDAPLLLVEGDERVLVAADLHLGLEHELWLGGVSIPSQTEKILARLLGFLAEIKPDRLLLLGDLKQRSQDELAGEEGDPRILAPALRPGYSGDRAGKS
jgi:metallophosphoesterase superfamily enzyme